MGILYGLMRKNAIKITPGVGVIFLGLNILQRNHVLLAATVLFLTVEFILAAMDGAQVIIVIVQNILIRPGQHHNADGGTLVGSTLQVGQRFHEYKACADRADSLL